MKLEGWTTVAEKISTTNPTTLEAEFDCVLLTTVPRPPEEENGRCFLGWGCIGLQTWAGLGVHGGGVVCQGGVSGA